MYGKIKRSDGHHSLTRVLEYRIHQIVVSGFSIRLIFVLFSSVNGRYGVYFGYPPIVHPGRI